MSRHATRGMALVLSIVALAFVAALNLGPAFGGKEPTPVVTHPGTASQPAPSVRECAPVTAAPATPPAEELNYCPADSPDGPAPDWSANPHRHGYCRCSCGYPCQSDADCGGASCDPFIPCC